MTIVVAATTAPKANLILPINILPFCFFIVRPRGRMIPRRGEGATLSAWFLE
jgi:hypothetical protein